MDDGKGAKSHVKGAHCAGEPWHFRNFRDPTIHDFYFGMSAYFYWKHDCETLPHMEKQRVAIAASFGLNVRGLDDRPPPFNFGGM